MQINLFDDSQRIKLMPFTLTRPCAEIRIGILTIKEKWEQILDARYGYISESYLAQKFPSLPATLNINGRLIPDMEILKAISALQDGEELVSGNVVLAYKGNDSRNQIIYPNNFQILERPWEIFSWNHTQIQADFNILTKGKTSIKLSDTNKIIGNFPVFAEEGVWAECSVFNATEGPIYLGKNSEIQEGSFIRGPFALCKHSTVKMGSKIYTGTTIGPHCKVGGEINNSVIFGYSNKAHDGFLGNSVIGEWCNIGADSNNSNLKNNYEEVKIWDYEKKGFVKTGLQFCGLMMGDHSKCGINTMFNTGTVVGVSANIFGSGFPRNYIPSFAWGGASGFDTFQLPKALETATKVFERRKKNFDTIEKEILTTIFEQTKEARFWEKE